ncbi:MAG: undecaprenyl-diphosphate phosphatase [Candidatus Omnitrophica bacterium]|nr:undecaprenyl-diphosphate phosphatase [Candidatus Omnitrophota bacterium]
MDITHAIILAVVEGLTEFLPVSSTGHMIIASQLLHMPQTEFLKTFEIAIQLGAIGAVFSLYWRVFLLDWEVGKKVMAAFIPTAVIGFFLYKAIKQFLLGNMMVVAVAMLLGGIFLVVFELLYKGKQGNIQGMDRITYTQAITIGLCQALAVIPGVSRSAATIVGGLMLGISRRAIVEFSFLLAVPTMLAATALDLLKSSSSISFADAGVLGVGFGTAFIVAFATVKFLLCYVQANDFIPFGIYRIVVGMVLLFCFMRS